MPWDESDWPLAFIFTVLSMQQDDYQDREADGDVLVQQVPTTLSARPDIA